MLNDDKLADRSNPKSFLEDDSPTMLPQFENHVSCLLLFGEK